MLELNNSVFLQRKVVKRQRGFTLIELMIVVGLVAIMAVIGVGAYQSLKMKVTVRALVETVEELITETRIHALTYGQNVALCPVADSVTQTVPKVCLEWQDLTTMAGESSSRVGWVIFTDNDNDAVVNVRDDIVDMRQFQRNSNVAISSTYTDKKIVRFTRKGSPAGQTGTVTIQSTVAPVVKREIVIQLATGRIQSRYEKGDN